jgi:hypothetical protein
MAGRNAEFQGGASGMGGDAYPISTMQSAAQPQFHGGGLLAWSNDVPGGGNANGQSQQNYLMSDPNVKLRNLNSAGGSPGASYMNA